MLRDLFHVIQWSNRKLASNSAYSCVSRNRESVEHYIYIIYLQTTPASNKTVDHMKYLNKYLSTLKCYMK